MPKLKTGTILPNPTEDAAITAAALADPDAASLTDAEWLQAKPLVHRGRTLGSGSKTQVTLRLDVEVVEKFRATGDGWQTRINDALKSWVRTHA
ncbi:MAG: BrnA antitoxin family protein [Polaromonas sp.]|uniref:BrnA antitoxin family protein n=1 Tax=Polaromonas sp. TaxID=1869339 RepID=UPI002487CF80|nr:BrnA antitoxin family protein [Polaromonas sp.]MDI1270642.1 BrnA antitoxin family protein [Polaromonas sp.]